MGKIYSGITGRLTLPQMLQTLRPEAKAEALAQPSLPQIVQTTAKWAFSLEDDAGRFLVSMAIVPDGNRRGWLVTYFADAPHSAHKLRPMLDLFWNFTQSGAVYDELRAWVVSDDARAIRFAEWANFKLDCGPASGYSPTGKDMNLYLWRR